MREWTWDQIQRVAVEDTRVSKELRGKGVERQRRGPTPRSTRCARWPQKTWEDWSKKTPLAKKAYDSQMAWLKELGSSRDGEAGQPATLAGAAARSTRRSLLHAVDRLNEWVGWLLGAVDRLRHRRRSSTRWSSRGVFGQATSWVNETTIYLVGRPTCWSAAMRCCIAATSAST